MSGSRTRPAWPLPLACAAIPAVAMLVAWPLSVAGGFIPDCNPFVDGCASISRAARHGDAKPIFKALMLPCAALQAWHWWVSAAWVDARGGESRGLRPIGIVAGIALAVYAAALGTEGWAYGWMRRYGINFYFAGSFLAMVLFLRQVRDLGGHPRVRASFMALCWLMLALGMASALLPAFRLPRARADLWQNVMEWHLGALFTAWFLLHAALWWRTRWRFRSARG